jgi:outer membrane receptor protein involved in Fe transport
MLSKPRFHPCNGAKNAAMAGTGLFFLRPAAMIRMKLLNIKRRADGIEAAWAVTLIFLAIHSAFSATTVNVDSSSLIDLSLADLQQVRVTAGTLDETERRTSPVTITTITSQDIRDSGARNLNELLEIYVPNMLYLRHNWEASHIGIRGVIGDVDNSYLLLVNGKVMNHVAHAGALSERDLDLLGDIKEIQVVRGPGSAVYGAGALIGVIDIRTFNGTTFNGTEVTARAGEVEEFYALEIKHGIDFSDHAHLFVYAGIADLVGAANSDAPLIPGLSGFAFDGTPVAAGKQYPLSLPNDRHSYLGHPQLKLHAELTVGDFSLWTRYTRGGEAQPFEQRWLLQPPQGFEGDTPSSVDDPRTFHVQGVGYQQISAGADYRRELSDHWDLAGRAGYSLEDFYRTETDGVLDANREDIYNIRLLATWRSSDIHYLTFGAEFQHGEFGLSPLGFGGGPARSLEWAGANPTPSGVTGFMPRWSTDTYSFLAEDHWEITPHWNLFTDLRVDKNYQTDFMYSPRAGLIYTPSAKDTFKVIVSQAVKADVAETLEYEKQINGSRGETETLRSVELSYNRLIGEHLSISGNGFYNSFRPIGWNDALNRTTAVGTETIMGGEVEVDYQSGPFQVGLSHGYSKLVSFHTSASGIEGQAISAQPYGFGHDLNHWSTHITKLQFTYQPVRKLRFAGSLRIFWGWPGFKDYTDYANSVGVDSGGDPLEFLRDANYNPYNRIQARLNLGATYTISKHWSAGVHGYNLLGLIDGRLNDRFIMFSSSAVREAPAVAVTLSGKF